MQDGPFKPGDRVPVTGIYTATHYQHRMPHDVFAVEGDRFPVCRRCGLRSVFTLSQTASHIKADRDFSGGAEDLKAKKAQAGGKKNGTAD